MEHLSVSAKFLFFNGEKRYTVMFQYGLMKWFIFNEEETTGAIFTKNIDPRKSKSPNRELAENVLYEYLDSITIKHHQ